MSDKLQLYKHLYVTYLDIISKQFKNTLLVTFPRYNFAVDNHRQSVLPQATRKATHVQPLEHTDKSGQGTNGLSHGTSG